FRRIPDLFRLWSWKTLLFDLLLCALFLLIVLSLLLLDLADFLALILILASSFFTHVDLPLAVAVDLGGANVPTILDLKLLVLDFIVGRFDAQRPRKVLPKRWRHGRTAD